MRITKTAVMLMCISLSLGCCAGITQTLSGQLQEKQHLNPLVDDVDYSQYERGCVQQGWKEISVVVGGQNRHLLWKGTESAWRNGAIVALHGGGGSCTNWNADFPLNRGMKAFVDLAVANGFAVFALDSGKNLATDESGNAAGKRFDCMATRTRKNVDLPFVEHVLTKVIPKVRPAGSANEIFMTGISNGGFMTILAATHFSNQIAAFAPVAAGDPYGTHFDCRKGLTARECAPGLFIDNETGLSLTQDDASLAKTYPHEHEWPASRTGVRPPFMLVYNEADAIVDASCKRKAEQLLVQHGYPNYGSFVLPRIGRKSGLAHFWSTRYNQPIIDFFARVRQERSAKFTSRETSS